MTLLAAGVLATGNGPAQAASDGRIYEVWNAPGRCGTTAIPEAVDPATGAVSQPGSPWGITASAVPGGSQILLTRADGTLSIANADGSQGLRPLPAAASAGAGAFCPGRSLDGSGQYIAYVAATGHIHYAAVSGASDVDLGQVGSNPVVSPDGNLVAFADSGANLDVVKTDATGFRQLIPASSGPRSWRWFPDSQHLALIGAGPGCSGTAGDVETYDLASGGLNRLGVVVCPTGSSGASFTPQDVAVSPDGSRLAVDGLYSVCSPAPGFTCAAGELSPGGFFYQEQLAIGPSSGGPPATPIRKLTGQCFGGASGCVDPAGGPLASGPGPGFAPGSLWWGGSATYVAMGDSYGAGVGNDPMGPAPCSRSSVSYAQLLQLSLDLRQVACSGATTSTDASQFNALGPETQLATIYIGGNDVGFAQLIRSCVSASFANTPCWQEKLGATTVGAFFAGELQKLRSRLLSQYREIRAKAPHARILVLGYPNFFPASFQRRCLTIQVPSKLGNLTLGQGIKPQDVPWFHDRIDELNNVIRDAVITAGVDAEYVPTGGEFGGHDLCQPNDQAWFFPIILYGPRTFVSVHPNGPGEAAIARAIAAQLKRLPPSGITFKLSAGQQSTASTKVGGGLLARVFSLVWPGSRFTLSLRSPTGRVIDAAHLPRGVIHTRGPSYDLYVVPAAARGRWKLTVKAIAVSQSNEPVDVEIRGLAIPCVVPKLAGTSVSAAGRALRKAHCRLGLTMRVKSRNVTRGHVVGAVGPAAGVYPTGTRVDLRIN